MDAAATPRNPVEGGATPGRRIARFAKAATERMPGAARATARTLPPTTYRWMSFGREKRSLSVSPPKMSKLGNHRSVEAGRASHFCKRHTIGIRETVSPTESQRQAIRAGFRPSLITVASGGLLYLRTSPESTLAGRLGIGAILHPPKVSMETHTIRNYGLNEKLLDGHDSSLLSLLLAVGLTID